MNTLDDNLTPNNPSNNKGLIHISNYLLALGLFTLVIIILISFFDGLAAITYIKDSPVFSRNFRVVYYLGLLFLPAIMGIYFIILSYQFETYGKDYSSKHFSKILRLNTQLLFIVLIWILMVTCFMLGYVTI